MANDPKDKRKKRLKEIAFAAFTLSLGAAGWFLIALLANAMNPRELSISFASVVSPIAVALVMYLLCKYVEKKAEGIVTEREEEEERRRRELLAAINYAPRPATTRNPSDS
jgi:hypothetical protein